MDSIRSNVSSGYAYSEYSSPEQTENSMNINKISRREQPYYQFSDEKSDNIMMSDSVIDLYRDLTRIHKPKNTHKYNTWEITKEHEGLNFDDNRRSNIFVDAYKKLKNPDEIVNPTNINERLIFKHHSHFISITINGNKKFFDLFEIYKNSKSIQVNKRKSIYEYIKAKIFPK